MVRFALLKTARGTIGYFANLISHTKKAMMMARPMANGTRTWVLFHSYCMMYVSILYRPVICPKLT